MPLRPTRTGRGWLVKVPIYGSPVCATDARHGPVPDQSRPVGHEATHVPGRLVGLADLPAGGRRPAIFILDGLAVPPGSALAPSEGGYPHVSQR